jgi:hypothetical protein
MPVVDDSPLTRKLRKLKRRMERATEAHLEAFYALRDARGELAESRGRWDNEREKRLVRALEEDEARLGEEAIATFRAWREAVDACFEP